MANGLWKKLILSTCLALSSQFSFGQKGKAEADYYPIGYSGDIWAGKVVAVDGKERTLTLEAEKKRFTVYVPDAPYEWILNKHRQRCVDFQYDLKANGQQFKYQGFETSIADILPAPLDNGMMRRPNPPSDNRISEENFATFLGRKVVAYYFSRKQPEVWRIEINAK
jgi:hypothetical protein